MSAQEFRAVVEPRRQGGIALKVPFDPAVKWGERERYDVTGTVDGHRVRGKLIPRPQGFYLELGPAWCRDEVVAEGTRVLVSLEPEGPQVAAMDADIAAAFSGKPAARRFFESLPTFYRKNYLRWIQDAKRPETRAKRVAEMVDLLGAGKRQR
jgi:hypothetical protein